MPADTTGTAVQILDLMLDFFADDNHWTRGRSNRWFLRRWSRQRADRSAVELSIPTMGIDQRLSNNWTHQRRGKAYRR